MTLFSQTNTKNKMLNVNFSLFLTQLVHTGGPPMQWETLQREIYRPIWVDPFRLSLTFFTPIDLLLL